MTRRFFYDCEFIDDSKTIDLISIGMVDDAGREYYAVNADMPFDRIPKHDWLVRNVLPLLPLRNRQVLESFLEHPNNLYPRPSLDMLGLDRTDSRVKPRWVIANEVRDFLLTGDEPQLWAYYAAYDHVALAQLFGPMIALPKGVPMFTHELMQLWEQAGRPLPPVQTDEHDALADARWNRDLFNACVEAGARL
jgi:hypothetical protein